MVEIKFYFVFCVLATLVKKLNLTKKVWALFLVTISIVSVVLFPPSEWSENAQGLQWYIPIFVLGCFVAMCQYDYKNKLIKLAVIWDIIALLVIIVMLFKVPIIQKNFFGAIIDDRLMKQYLQMGIAFAIFILAALNSKYCRKILEKATLLQNIGRASYSIYLTHYIILWKLKYCTKSISCFLVLFVVLTAISSAVLYFGVEKKFMKYMNSHT